MVCRHSINFSKFLVNQFDNMFFIVLQPDQIAELFLQFQLLRFLEQSHQLALFILLDHLLEVILEDVPLLYQGLNLGAKLMVLILKGFVQLGHFH